MRIFWLWLLLLKERSFRSPYKMPHLRTFFKMWLMVHDAWLTWLLCSFECLSGHRGSLDMSDRVQAAALVSFRRNTGSPRPSVLLLIILWRVVAPLDVKHVGKMSARASSSCQSPWINLRAPVWGHWSPSFGSCVWTGSSLNSAYQNTNLIVLKSSVWSVGSGRCLVGKLIFSTTVVLL